MTDILQVLEGYTHKVKSKSITETFFMYSFFNKHHTLTQYVTKIITVKPVLRDHLLLETSVARTENFINFLTEYNLC